MIPFLIMSTIVYLMVGTAFDVIKYDDEPWRVHDITTVLVWPLFAGKALIRGIVNIPTNLAKTVSNMRNNAGLIGGTVKRLKEF